MIHTNGSIMLAHGGGGQLTDELIQHSIMPRLGNPVLDELLDSAMVGDVDGKGRLAMTLDSYVVQPWKFPGGNIGRLAVCGTVNDLAVCGAKPLGIALGLILSEGFRTRDLEEVLDAIRAAADEAGVNIVTGDTKVVDRQSGDGVFITTAGVGIVPHNVSLSPKCVQPGDVLIVNGPIGEHGLAVMLEREMPEVTSVLTTDAAPLNGLIDAVMAGRTDAFAFMRDATRSGLSGVVSDLALQSGLHVELDEARVPIRREALHAADMLGLDPLEVANEGKAVFVVRAEAAEAVLAQMRQHPLGREAAIIGRVTDTRDGIAELRTSIGGRRIIQKPYGEQLPRIC